MGCSVPAGAWSSAYGRPAEPRHRAALGAIPALLTCSSSPSQPCWNSRIHSQDEEEPSEHLLHLIPQRQSTPKADTPSDNRQQSGLLWQPVEGLMLLSSIRKGKKEDRGEKKQNHHHHTNPNPTTNHHHQTHEQSQLGTPPSTVIRAFGQLKAPHPTPLCLLAEALWALSGDKTYPLAALPGPPCHCTPLPALINNSSGLWERHSSPCFAQKINDALMDAEGKANQSGTYRFMIAQPHY